MRPTPQPPPFGGAELKEPGTHLETCRSSERRITFCNVPVYKHVTPNGGETRSSFRTNEVEIETASWLFNHLSGMKEIAKGSAKGSLVADVLAGSWRRSVSPAIGITESQLDEVTPLLYASGGAALGWWRVKETALRATPSGEVLHQAYRLQALQSRIHEQKIKKVFHLLRQANVEPILAKGWAASNLYPDRALRAYGDIDLLVREQEIARAEEVLASRESSDCWVDLHGRFSELADRTVDNLFERSRLADLNGEQIRILSDEDHLALLAIHLLKHGAWRPLWLCDIAAAIESTPKDFNWDICLGRDKRRMGWIAVALALAMELFGAESKYLTERAHAKLPTWLVKSVLKQWGRLFPANHLPIQALPLMVTNLRNPLRLLKATWQRWPDPITATFNLNGCFSGFPRLPYQIGALVSQSGRFLIDLPTKLDQRR